MSFITTVYSQTINLETNSECNQAEIDICFDRFNNTMCSIIDNTATPPEPVAYCWGQTCSTENDNLCTNENFNSDCIVLEVDAQDYECFAPGCDEDWECVTNYCEIDENYVAGSVYPVEGNGSTKAGICKDCT